MSTVLDKLRQWYWTIGITRGENPDDPDRELRKMPIGEWLDPVEQIIARNNAMHANAYGKACLAVWGPSQSGKSTILGRYVDGDHFNGYTSALTWSDNHLTRFSVPPGEGIGVVDLNETLIFNPFNNSKDASGVATRYTLKSDTGDAINVEYPVEVKFTTRTQIILSLALGYLAKCKRVKSIRFESAEDLLGEGVTEQNVSNKQEIYEIVKDIADAIEFMKGEYRFLCLFEKDDWNVTREKLVSASGILRDKASAEDFLASVFWDSNERLTSFYQEAEKLREKLLREWAGCKILASMEAASLLLDIDSYAIFCNRDNTAREEERRKARKIEKLAYEIVGNEVHIFVADRNGSENICGRQFGYFQAVCSELVVPLRRTKLEARERDTQAFINLLERCDLLDFPGLSDERDGNNQKYTEEVDLSVPGDETEIKLFTRVFKQGKTQCFVYSYVKSYGIDTFAILCRVLEEPSQSSLLNAGVIEWIHSFKPNWTSSQGLDDLSIFVNLTFFSKLLNNVDTNGRTVPLHPACERIEKLMFAKANPPISKFYATTYQQFHEGEIRNPEHENRVIDDILSDLEFRSLTGLSREDLEKVYNAGGGQDYMLEGIANRLVNARVVVETGGVFRPEKRITLCNDILRKDLEALTGLIKRHLPSADGGANARTEALRACVDKIDEDLNSIPNDDDESLLKLAENLESFFSVDKEIFENVPLNAARKAPSELISYIKKQIMRWVNDRDANACSKGSPLYRFKTDILGALHDSFGDREIDELVELLQYQLGGIDEENTKAARYLFSLAFSNLLRYGCVIVPSEFTVGEMNPETLNMFVNRTLSPYRIAIQKLRDRIKILAESGRIQNNRLPQPGDDELQALLAEINQSKIFTI